MTSTPALLLAAGGVGLAHAVLPDHWVPLAVVARTRRYPLTRVARLSGMAGLAHVLVSVLLGAIVVVVGLQFRSTVEHAQDTIVGLLLIGTGVAFVVLDLTGHGHDHDHTHTHQHASEHDHPSQHAPGHAARSASRFSSAAAIMVPFGAAASPDLTILPVFLAASAVGPGPAVGALVVFATVTIGTIVTLTLAATAGGYQVRGQWLERWANRLTAFVLLVIGLLVLVGLI